MSKTARIYLNGDRDMHLGINKLKGSKAEVHIRMDRNAVWNCNHGGQLFFDTTLEIKESARFDSGYFTVNGGSVIIAHKHIIFGEDVMLGRNIIVYDSDFHQILDKDGRPFNEPKTVKIEDHVWLTSNITVLKGVTIGRDSLVTAQTVINKNMPEHSIIAGGASGKQIKDSINWCRDIFPHECIRFDSD